MASDNTSAWTPPDDFDPIELFNQLVADIEGVGHQVAAIPGKIEDVPGSVIKEMQETAASIAPRVGAIPAALKELTTDIDDVAQFAVKTVTAIRKDVASFDANGFRTHFRLFHTAMADLTAEAERMGGPTLKIPQMSWIDTVIDDMPPILLLPIAKALEVHPQWWRVPAQIKQELQAVQPVANTPTPSVVLTSPEDYIKLVKGVSNAKMFIKSGTNIIQAALDIMPDQFTIGADVVGEGATISVPTTPYKAIFLVSRVILDILDNILDRELAIAAIEALEEEPKK